jgi:hypothetical protein
MFNMARIPKPICDILSKPPAPSQPDAQKIYIMIHGWCYAISVYHPGIQPTLLDVQEIETRIRSAVMDAQQRLAGGEKAVPIGALTADERDRWTKVRSYAPMSYRRLPFPRICNIFLTCRLKIREATKSSVIPFSGSVSTDHPQRPRSLAKRGSLPTFAPSDRPTRMSPTGYLTNLARSS